MIEADIENLKDRIADLELTRNKLSDIINLEGLYLVQSKGHHIGILRGKEAAEALRDGYVKNNSWADPPTVYPPGT